jgi:Na+-driven multidrug efflux pump
MAVPIAGGMQMQTLYYLVYLYFVGRLGDAALAGGGRKHTARARKQRGQVAHLHRSGGKGWPVGQPYASSTWYLSVASVALQAVTSLLLLRHALASGVSAEVPAHADPVGSDVVAELAFGEGGELVREEPARRGAE